MEESSRIARLLGILLMLRSREWVAAHDLAERFGVSLRTIYRDIETLQQHGIAVQGTIGRIGGYRLATEAPVDLNQFASDSTIGLFLLGAVGPGIPDALQRRAEQVLNSLKHSLPDEQVETLKRINQRIYFDTSDWYWQGEGTALLPVLRSAIMQCRQLALSYNERATDVSTTFDVRPYGLAWKGGEWYLVGYVVLERRIRRFRLSRIASLTEHDHTFEYPNDFVLAAWWRDEMSQFGMGDTKVVFDAFGNAQRELLTLKRKESTRIEQFGEFTRITLLVDKWAWLVPLLMSYGSQVIVRQPAALRNEIVNECRNLLLLYKDRGRQKPQSFVNDDSRQRATRGRQLNGGRE